MHFAADRAESIANVLRRALPAWSACTLRQRLRHGLVFVDDVPVRDPRHPVVSGAAVRVDAPRPRDAASLRPPFPILHEDASLIVVDKPAGLRSVADAGESDRTVTRLLKRHLAARRSRRPDAAFGRPSRRGDSRGTPGCWVVHRLDRATSGVLALARSWRAKQTLVAGWHTVEKVYYAVTCGLPDPPEGIVEEPLKEGAGLFVRVSRAADAAPALTRYRVLAAESSRALVELRPETGRKHQLRVHLAWLGTPVAGDERYGHSRPPPGCPRRLYLHAARLTLPHPADGRRITFFSPPPAEFSAAVPAAREMLQSLQ